MSEEDRAFFKKFEGDRQAPASVDLRDLGQVTDVSAKHDTGCPKESLFSLFDPKVKNQGYCGSCASFSATAMFESAMIRAGASKSGLDLAEQQALNCCPDSGK